MVTYEGTSQVKETKMDMLVYQYELFKMQLEESTKEMFTQLDSQITKQPEVTWQDLY